MRFLSPLHRLICIFHRPLRMLMHRLVVFFAGPMRGIASTLPSEGASFSGLDESVVLKRGWDLVGFQVNTLLEKFLGHCPKKNIPPRCHSFRMCSDGKTERYRTALGGASGICHLAVLLVFICRFAPTIALYDSQRPFSPVPGGNLRPGILCFAFWPHPIFLPCQRTPRLLASLMFVLCRCGPDVPRRCPRLVCGEVSCEVGERREAYHSGVGGAFCGTSSRSDFGSGNSRCWHSERAGKH
jgi:hypothetical protein